MKIFISWSGKRSGIMAEALHEFLGDVLHAAKPWLSLKDIDRGIRWAEKLAQELSGTRCGIICVTRDNLSSPWLLFEAGALARSLRRSLVCPYLLDLKASEVAGPLAQFQCVLPTLADTLALVETLNKTLGAKALPDQRLRRSFDRAWPALEKTLDSVPEQGSDSPAKRSSSDILEEVLSHVRELRFGQGGPVLAEKETAKRQEAPSPNASWEEIARFFEAKLFPKAERQAHKDYIGISLTDEWTTKRERALALAEKAARDMGLENAWKRWRESGKPWGGVAPNQAPAADG